MFSETLSEYTQLYEQTVRSSKGVVERGPRTDECGAPTLRVLAPTKTQNPHPRFLPSRSAPQHVLKTLQCSYTWCCACTFTVWKDSGLWGAESRCDENRPRGPRVICVGPRRWTVGSGARLSLRLAAPDESVRPRF